jgi:hypothetical protein
MQEPALARTPRHFVRMACGLSIHKVVHFCNLLLYILAIELAIDDIATYYSRQSAILLFLLSHIVTAFALFSPTQTKGQLERRLDLRR